MIKTNELRLGNIVSVNKGFEMYVSAIFKDTVYLDFEGNEGDVFEEKEKDVKPIPLTEDWIAIFGFEKTESDYQIKIQNDDKLGNSDYWIYVDLGIDNNTNEITIQIVSQEGDWYTSKNKYVHQLQNLYYSLTGEELTIKK